MRGRSARPCARRAGPSTRCTTRRKGAWRPGPPGRPWGLLAWGALLAGVAEGDCETALGALNMAGVDAARIGSMVKPEAGVIMVAQARSTMVPRFARDEVAS